MISGLSTRKKTASVGLDITSESIAATEVQNGGSVGRTAIVPLQPGVVKEGDLVNREVLSDALKDLFSRHKLNKTVRVGVANQRVVVRTMQLPLIEDDEELETAVRFRAQEAIPMPLEQAVLDHQVVGKRDGADGNRVMDVLAVAARRDMVAGLLEAVRGAGLEPVGIDLSAFGMIRALKDRSAPASSQMGELPAATALYCHLGDVTNLAVARGSECVFARVSPFGIETIADRLASRLSIAIDEARDRIMEIGLEEDVELFTDEGREGDPRGPGGGRHQARGGAPDVDGLLRRAGRRHAGRRCRALRPGEHDSGSARAGSGRPDPWGLGRPSGGTGAPR